MITDKDDVSLSDYGEYLSEGCILGYGYGSGVCSASNKCKGYGDGLILGSGYLDKLGYGFGQGEGSGHGLCHGQDFDYGIADEEWE